MKTTSPAPDAILQTAFGFWNSKAGWRESPGAERHANANLLLLAVAILASYVLALRATKVDPITALRAQ